jgi:hypothetical protein
MSPETRYARLGDLHLAARCSMPSVLIERP